MWLSLSELFVVESLHAGAERGVRSGSNFRLLTRLLTQIERFLSVKNLHLVSTAVVEAARDSLVIGPG